MRNGIGCKVFWKWLLTLALADSMSAQQIQPVVWTKEQVAELNVLVDNWVYAHYRGANITAKYSTLLPSGEMNVARSVSVPVSPNSQLGRLGAASININTLCKAVPTPPDNQTYKLLCNESH